MSKKTGRISVRIENRLKREVETILKNQNLSVSDVVREFFLRVIESKNASFIKKEAATEPKN